MKKVLLGSLLFVVIIALSFTGTSTITAQDLPLDPVGIH
ncbi:hypothetical protein EV586_103145 [Tumebacillus sp. BK434]|nr:hypothetical protein EV586_103145 [Tumebacillus sp. BK434]